MAPVKNLVVNQGSDFSVTLLLADESNTALDLTTYTFSALLARDFYADNIGFTTSTSNPSSGELILSLTAAQTAVLKSGRYVYTADIISDTHIVTRVAQGLVTVNPGVLI